MCIAFFSFNPANSIYKLSVLANSPTLPLLRVDLHIMFSLCFVGCSLHGMYSKNGSYMLVLSFVCDMVFFLQRLCSF